MATTLNDVIIPELFNPYTINRTAELSAFVQSGIITRSSEFDILASQAAPTVNMPFFEDLTGESEQIIEGEELNPAKINSNVDIAVIIRRAKAWADTDLSGALSGTDPMRAIADLVAGFWARDLQRELINLLKGVFASESMKDNILDISKLSGDKAKWGLDSFIDAQQLLGDNQGILSAIAMHSATKSHLKKQNAIETERASNSVDFETYQGKRIIIDDGLPVTNGVYTTYLFGAGAIALGNGNPPKFVPTELERKALMGSGVNYLINRKTMILHPRGIKFTKYDVNATEGPSRAELAKGENWQRAYEQKQIRIVEFRHR